MPARKILVLNGHPAESSLSRHLAETYADAANAAGHDVTLLHLRDLQFDPDHGFAGYRQHKPFEPDLERFLTALHHCDHFVLISPMWWGGLPAKLKGLIDRSFWPGRVFDSRGKGLPKPLLTGRSGRVILTSDSPWWYFRFLLHRPLYWALRRQIFEFVGIKPFRMTHFAQASHTNTAQVQGWTAKVRKLGRIGA
ncbi:NAD(P)H-dependent oxidoreductase [Aliiroseovarius crassostreae]|uniref:NAD(P)H-dependent oxidoreductase n=1 Tax=Aliiroseovarius crassostreae TaxID=154981 RepID=UPI003C7AE251